jgi:GTP-binding protein HflX
VLAQVVELVVPYERGDVVAAVHRAGEGLSEDLGPDATHLRARLDTAEAERFAEFRTA